MTQALTGLKMENKAGSKQEESNSVDLQKIVLDFFLTTFANKNKIAKNVNDITNSRQELANILPALYPDKSEMFRVLHTIEGLGRSSFRPDFNNIEKINGYIQKLIETSDKIKNKSLELEVSMLTLNEDQVYSPLFRTNTALKDAYLIFKNCFDSSNNKVPTEAMSLIKFAIEQTNGLLGNELASPISKLTNVTESFDRISKERLIFIRSKTKKGAPKDEINAAAIGRLYQFFLKSVPEISTDYQIESLANLKLSAENKRYVSSANMVLLCCMSAGLFYSQDRVDKIIERWMQYV